MRVCYSQQKQNMASFNNSAILQAGKVSGFALSGIWSGHQGLGLYQSWFGITMQIQRTAKSAAADLRR